MADVLRVAVCCNKKVTPAAAAPAATVKFKGLTKTGRMKVKWTQLGLVFFLMLSLVMTGCFFWQYQLPKLLPGETKRYWQLVMDQSARQKKRFWNIKNIFSEQPLFLPILKRLSFSNRLQTSYVGLFRLSWKYKLQLIVCCCSTVCTFQPDLWKNETFF